MRNGALTRALKISSAVKTRWVSGRIWNDSIVRNYREGVRRACYNSVSAGFGPSSMALDDTFEQQLDARWNIDAL